MIVQAGLLTPLPFPRPSRTQAFVQWHSMLKRFRRRHAGGEGHSGGPVLDLHEVPF
jgi:hypothetical protein